MSCTYGLEWNKSKMSSRNIDQNVVNANQSLATANADSDMRALAIANDVRADFREMFEFEIFRERFPDYDFYAASISDLEDVPLSIRLSIRQEATRKVAKNVEVLLLLIQASAMNVQ